MTTYLTSGGIIFPNGTSMITAPVQGGANLGGAGAGIVLDRSGDTIRFKQIAVTGVLGLTANTTHLIISAAATGGAPPPTK